MLFYSKHFKAKLLATLKETKNKTKTRQNNNFCGFKLISWPRENEEGSASSFSID